MDESQSGRAGPRDGARPPARFRQQTTDYILFEPEDHLPVDVAGKVFRNPNGVNIRDPDPHNRPEPMAVYFVWLHFNADGKLEVRQKAGRRQAGEAIADAEARLAANIRSDYDSTNFADMVWTEPCYLSFLIENPGWKFYWRNSDVRHGPIRFFRRKDKIPSETRIYGDNWAFYMARQFWIGQRHGFRCRNFVSDENGRLGPGEKIDYCFQIYLEAPFAIGTESIIMLIDPDGQNQGPGGR